MNPNFCSIIKYYYPNISWSKHYVGASTFVFSKNFDPVSTSIQENSSVKPIKLNTEWSKPLTIALDTILIQPNDELVLTVELGNTNPLDDISLVSSVQSENGILHWSEMKLEEYLTDSSRSWQRIIHTIQFSNISLPKDAILKTFVWNKTKGEINVRNLNVKFQEGNKVVYGLRDEF